MGTQSVMAIIWLALFVVFVVVELLTQGITTIWFAGGSVLALFAAALDASLLVQIILFLVTSIVLLVFTRPTLIKLLNNRLVRTNVEAVVGKIATVKEDINNVDGCGVVVLDGMDWSAKSLNNVVIEKNEKVVVRNVEGVKLIVEIA